MDKEYYAKQAYPRFYDSTSGERLPLAVVLKNHLDGCEKCQYIIAKKPIGLGQRSRLCFSYQDIIQDWADLEGYLNDIVAKDEYGNEAPRSQDPAKNPEQWR